MSFPTNKVSSVGCIYILFRMPLKVAVKSSLIWRKSIRDRTSKFLKSPINSKANYEKKKKENYEKKLSAKKR